MTALEEIKKALEGVTPDAWRYRMKNWSEQYWHHFSTEPRFKEPDEIWEPLYSPSSLAPTLKSLQRENERLQAEIDRKSSMPGDHRYWEGRYRDEAAENEKLRVALKPFADVAKYYDPPEEDENQKLWGIATMPTIGNVRDARTALASTGGEHHAE
jgi:hypothetical protein